jgi:hypothetical protein
MSTRTFSVMGIGCSGREAAPALSDEGIFAKLANNIAWDLGIGKWDR